MLREDCPEALRLLKMAEDLATDYFDDISEEQADVLLRTAQVLLLKREDESSRCTHVFHLQSNSCTHFIYVLAFPDVDARSEELLNKAHEMFVTIHTLTHHKALACKVSSFVVYLCICMCVVCHKEMKFNGVVTCVKLQRKITSKLRSIRFEKTVIKLTSFG